MGENLFGDKKLWFQTRILFYKGFYLQSVWNKTLHVPYDPKLHTSMTKEPQAHHLPKAMINPFHYTFNYIDQGIASNITRTQTQGPNSTPRLATCSRTNFHLAKIVTAMHITCKEKPLHSTTAIITNSIYDHHHTSPNTECNMPTTGVNVYQTHAYLINNVILIHTDESA